MITKEMAVNLVKAKAERVREERLNRAKNFCEEIVSKEIEAAATEGRTSIELNCDKDLAGAIAEYLKEQGGFWVRVDAMNGTTSGLLIRWNA